MLRSKKKKMVRNTVFHCMLGPNYRKYMIVILGYLVTAISKTVTAIANHSHLSVYLEINAPYIHTYIPYCYIIEG